MNKSRGWQLYLKKVKRRKALVYCSQVALLISFFLLWEIASHTGLISSFLFSKPSTIFGLLWSYLEKGVLFDHVWTSLTETFAGLVIGTITGLLIGIVLYFLPLVAKIFDPFLVVLNALPKTALAPILIVWCGAGFRGIVVIAIITSIVITVMSAHTYFQSVSEEKVKMFRTLGANRWQMMTKLVLPSNIANIINIIKINIGMSWIGVIVGEFLVARKGLGYLINTGGQTFRFDLVMMGVLVLAVLAWAMYQIVNYLEKYFRAKL